MWGHFFLVKMKFHSNIELTVVLYPRGRYLNMESQQELQSDPKHRGPQKEFLFKFCNPLYSLRIAATDTDLYLEQGFLFLFALSKV